MLKALRKDVVMLIKRNRKWIKEIRELNKTINEMIDVENKEIAELWKTIKELRKELQEEKEKLKSKKLMTEEEAYIVYRDYPKLKKKFEASIKRIKEKNDLKIKNLELKLDWINYRYGDVHGRGFKCSKSKSQPEPEIRWLKNSQTMEGVQGAIKTLIQFNKEIDTEIGDLK